MNPANNQEMNLTLFFRLIMGSIFNSSVCYSMRSHYDESGYKSLPRISSDDAYHGVHFSCPRVFAKDGFNVSLQASHGNYCDSNNGYRELGHSMIHVEFGFPSHNETLLHPYSELWDETDPEFDCRETVGRVPIEVLEKIFALRGGINWEKTISIEWFNKSVQ